MIIGDVDDLAAHFHTLEEKLSAAIEAVWPASARAAGPATVKADLEDPITRRLVFALRSRKSFPGRIITQYELLRLRSGQVVVPHRIDFVVTIGSDEEVYLACECKRLNVQPPSGFRTLAAEYVKEGLARFVDEEYSPDLPIAVMVGYVMDRNVPGAHASVLAEIASRSARLQLRRHHHALPSSTAARFATQHDRSSGVSIEVRHCLLRWP